MHKNYKDMMDDLVRLSEILDVLDRIREASADRVLLIEGLKDRAALNTLKIYGDMFQIQSEGGPVKAAEYVMAHGGKAIVLTDWDRTGGTVASEVVIQIKALGGICNTDARGDLAALCRKYIKDVEALDSLVMKLSGGSPDVLREGI